MTRRLFRQERIDLILARLQQTGYVSVAELADELDVSTVTVRTDLDTLEAEGQLQRTHGGAVAARSNEEVLSFAARLRQQVDAKDRIGAAAAALVHDGEALYIDASTSAWHTARHLISHRDIVVLTSGLHVALELTKGSGVGVGIPGGRVWREAGAVLGNFSERVNENMNLRHAFVGGRGFTLEEGLTDPSPEEASYKRQHVRLAHEVTVLADSSKWGRISVARIVSVNEVRRVITDQQAPEVMVAALLDRGIEVIQV